MLSYFADVPRMPSEVLSEVVALMVSLGTLGKTKGSWPQRRGDPNMKQNPPGTKMVTIPKTSIFPLQM